MLDSKGIKRWLKDNGYILETGGNGHLRVFTPDGERVGSISWSPSGGCRSAQNEIAALRRKGVPIPRK